MCALLPSKPAWSADANPPTPIIYALCKTAPSHARSATNSRYHYAGDIIASSIVTAMKSGGGTSSASIRPPRHERCGLKHIRPARINSPMLLLILMAFRQ